MGKTKKVAADRQYDETKTVIPTEYARGMYVRNPPSAMALKLMHLMIAKAGGRLADSVRHEFRLADIRTIQGMKNHDKESLRPLFEELHGAGLSYDDTEAMKIFIGGFLDHAEIDYRHEVTGDVLITWRFGGLFRDMAEKSNHWAIIDRQTVFALTSKYSILLFQYFASLQGLKHKTGEVFTVPQLRQLLGVSDGKLARFSNLNQRVLQPAISEINQLSRFTLTATPRKIGRTVASVEISWEPKPDPTETKRELDRPKVGRKARRNGRAETPVVAFPASGGIRYAEPWQTIAKTHGSGKDINLIAGDFRNWCAGRRHRKVCSLSNAKEEHLANLADFASLAPFSRVAEVQWSLI